MRSRSRAIGRLATTPDKGRKVHPFIESAIPGNFQPHAFQFLTNESADGRTFRLFVVRIRWPECKKETFSTNDPLKVLPMIEAVSNNRCGIRSVLTKLAEILVAIALCISGILERIDPSQL